MWLWSIYNCLITGYKHIEYNYSIDIMSFYEKKDSDKIIEPSHFLTVSCLFPSSCIFNINHVILLKWCI